MKSTFTTVFIVLVFAAASLGSAQGPKAGFKLGLNLADLYGDDVEDWGQESRMGICFGGFAGFGFGKILMIQPELLYSQKGIADEENGVEAAVKLDYIDVPIGFKVMVPVKGNVQPYLSAGPYFAFNINAELEAGDLELDLSDEVSDMDFGAVLGGGLGFGLSKGQIIFDVRYGLGLTSIDEDDGAPGDVKNGVFSFALGYAF